MYPAYLMRVSDADREAVVAQLGGATGEGRLTLDEFSDRAQKAYAARTWLELTSLVQDLPGAPKPGPQPTAPDQPVGGLPVVALICGLMSIAAAVCVPVGAIAGVVAMGLGGVALGGAPRDASGQRGLALAGMLCGSFGVAAVAAFVAVMSVISSS